MATDAEAETTSFEKQLCAAVMNGKGKEVKHLLMHTKEMQKASSEEIHELYFQILKVLPDGKEFLISRERAQLLNATICYAKLSWKHEWFSCKPKKYYRVEDYENDRKQILCDIGILLEHLLKDNAMNFYKSVIASDKVQNGKDGSPNAKNDNTCCCFKKAKSKVDALAEGSEVTAKKGIASDKVQSGKDGSDITCFCFKKTTPKDDAKTDIKAGWIRDLFIWTVLAGKWAMSKILLEFGKHQIGSALIGCALLKALAEKAESVGDLQLSQDLKKEAGRYEKMSVDTVTKCYQKDRRLAHKLLVRTMPAYTDNTLFTLSNSYTIMPFMDTTCCQTKLNKLWTGNIDHFTPQWKIYLSCFLVFLIPFTTFKETDLNKHGNGRGGKKQKRWSLVRNEVKDDRKLSNGCETQTVIGPFCKFYNSPIVIYTCYTISYVIFLAFFALFVLTDLRPGNMATWEYIAWIWICMFVFDEGRQIYMISKGSLCYKIKHWLESVWNWVDLVMYLSCLVGFIVRNTSENFVAVRTIYSIILAIFIIRIIEWFLVSKWIGPNVIALGKMFIDVLTFVGIFLVFLVSFGVMYQANLYPNSLLDWHLLKGIFYIPYWQLYGELYLDELKGEHDGTCTTDENVWRQNDGHGRCPEQNALVEVFGGIYLLLSNVLLLNLLIAMFSSTYTDIHNQSKEIWRFHRYGIVRTVYDFPFPCPPFNIFNILRVLVRRCQITPKHAFRKTYTCEEILDEFERMNYKKIYKGPVLDMTKTAGSGVSRPRPNRRNQISPDHRKSQ